MGQTKQIKTRYPAWLKLYVLKLQSEMKLSHWKIEFENYYCADLALAEIQIAPAQNSASLSLCKGWKKWNASLLRATIAHELMHCHINAINELAEEHLEELSPKTFAERKTGIDYVNERVTDSLAEMMAVHLTLPKIPVRTQAKTLSHAVAYSRTRNRQTRSSKVRKASKKSVKRKTSEKGKSRKRGK
jgi:hypothetical protein